MANVITTQDNTIVIVQASGITGRSGTPGPAGPTGSASTIAGPSGPAGSSGPAGPTGTASTVPGPTGPIGPSGPAGPTGSASTIAGPTGPIGPSGPAGPTGTASTVPGPTGPIGPSGPAGPTGSASTVPGPTGPIGPTGTASTVQGPTGPIGPSGPAGPTGAQGSAGQGGALYDSIPVNELVNDVWLFDTINRGISTDTSTFSSTTSEIIIAASSSNNQYYYTELSASEAGDGLIISDGSDLVRYKINSRITGSNTFTNFTSSSLLNISSSNNSTAFMPYPIYMESIDKLYILSGSTAGTNYGNRIRYWTASNPGVSAQLNSSFFYTPWIGRALNVTQSLFIHNSQTNQFIYLSSDSTSQISNSTTFQNTSPIPMAYGRGKVLIGKPHTRGKTIVDVDLSDLANPTLTIFEGTSAYYNFNGDVIGSGNNDHDTVYTIDSVYDSTNNTFYALDYNNFRGNFATCSISEITGSTSVNSGNLVIQGYKSCSLSFSDPYQGRSSATHDLAGRTMGIKESTSELFIYNRGEWFPGYVNNASIIKFDYSSGVTNGTFTKIIDITQPEGGLGNSNIDTQKSYGGLIYSEQNDVIVVGTYNTASSEGKVRVYEATPPYTLLQTIVGPFMTSTTTVTKEGIIIFPNGIDVNNRNSYVVLTPNIGDSETFVFNVSHYDYDPSITITPNNGNSIYAKLQLKDPVTTSPDGSKFRLTVANNGTLGTTEI
tara:strand:- start:9 stop:2159 length:2151 start_codon:yes stop_codon:yes gene_type:complete